MYRYLFRISPFFSFLPSVYPIIWWCLLFNDDTIRSEREKLKGVIHRSVDRLSDSLDADRYKIVGFIELSIRTRRNKWKRRKEEKERTKEKKKKKKRKIFDCIRGRNKESAACLVPSFLSLTNFPAFSVCARLFNFYEALVQSWGRSTIETRKEEKAASRSDCNSILSNVEQNTLSSNGYLVDCTSIISVSLFFPSLPILITFHHGRIGFSRGWRTFHDGSSRKVTWMKRLRTTVKRIGESFCS